MRWVWEKDVVKNTQGLLYRRCGDRMPLGGVGDCRYGIDGTTVG